MSQVKKLNYIDSKLGAPSSGQQTTRVIYDSVEFTYVAGNAPSKYYEFFTNAANKTIFKTNLPNMKLDSNESMVVKEIYIQAYSPTNEFGYWSNAWKYGSVFNLFIGNQCVIKDFNLATQWGVATGPVERLYSNDNDDVCYIRLLTDIVIPPQVNIKATIQYATTGANLAGPATLGLQLGLKGYGVLFNPGMSL